VLCNTPGPRCGKWSQLAVLADPGDDLSCVHGPRGIWLQRLWPAVTCCDVTQARMGVQGRFWDASGSTWKPMYTPFRGAALRRLVASARHQTISAFEPHFALFSPHQFWMDSPHQMQLRKFGRGIKSPHQNWKIGRGIPSQRFGAGIGNAIGDGH